MGDTTMAEERDDVWAYGTAAHEAWLLEMEAQDVEDARPDQPWTPCGCIARAYGGDCAHTIGDYE